VIGSNGNLNNIKKYKNNKYYKKKDKKNRLEFIWIIKQFNANLTRKHQFFFKKNKANLSEPPRPNIISKTCNLLNPKPDFNKKT
jgi:hypothetical protein